LLPSFVVVVVIAELRTPNIASQGHFQQLTGLIGLSIGSAYVRPVSC